MKVNDRWDDIEFINEKWYWIYWSAQYGTWSVSQNDQILQPGNYALGTKSEPYISVEDQSCLNLKKTFSSDTMQEDETSLQTKNDSPEDQPTVDWQEALAVEQIADILQELELAKTPKPKQQMSMTYAMQATTVEDALVQHVQPSRYGGALPNSW